MIKDCLIKTMQYTIHTGVCSGGTHADMVRALNFYTRRFGTSAYRLDMLQTLFTNWPELLPGARLITSEVPLFRLVTQSEGKAVVFCYTDVEQFMSGELDRQLAFAAMSLDGVYASIEYRVLLCDSAVLLREAVQHGHAVLAIARMRMRYSSLCR